MVTTPSLTAPCKTLAPPKTAVNIRPMITLSLPSLLRRLGLRFKLLNLRSQRRYRRSLPRLPIRKTACATPSSKKLLRRQPIWIEHSILSRPRFPFLICRTSSHSPVQLGHFGSPKCMRLLELLKHLTRARSPSLQFGIRGSRLTSRLPAPPIQTLPSQAGSLNLSLLSSMLGTLVVRPSLCH